MTIVGEAFIRIRPDDAGFSNEAEKGILSKVGGIASKAAGVFATGFAVKQGIDFFGGLIADASESRRVLAETEQAIKATGGAANVSASQISALADSLSKKTGIDDEAIQTGENLLLCLEESAQALTRDRGWVDHTALSVGDEILTYDPNDDSSRWEPIQDFYRYEVDTELIHWKSKQIDVKTTPHHRWWTVGTSGRSEFTPRFMTTEQISGHQYRVKIGGARPGGFLSEPVLSDDLVELLGWVVTEGTYNRWSDQPSRAGVRLCAICDAPARNRSGPMRCDGCAQNPIQNGRTTPRPKVTAETSRVSGIVFSQSQTANPKHVARIRELVDRLVRRGHTITETQYLARYNDSIMSAWSFCGPLAREVRRLLPDKKLTPELLGMLTQSQAESMLDTMLDGDGHRDAHGHRQYIQKDHGQLDVVAMLCAMLGIRTSVLDRGGDRDSIYLCATNHLKGSAVHAERVRYRGTVWCPQVRTGIFMARNRGRTFWTGNTFKNIRNETGKGNDIFNQATAAVLDLSKQFGGIEASSVQVGKALNDPIAGVTALTRVGIQFTEAQKDQIKALVETGDTLGAQKIILGEINAQVGGQAAAQATAADRLRVVWGNLREELGARLLPIVDKVATFLADRLPGALDKAGAVLGPVFTRIRDAVQGLFDLFVRGDFSGAFARAFHVEEDAPIVNVLFRVREALSNLVSFVRDNVQPILIGLAAAFLLAAGPVVAVGAALVLLYARFQVVRDVIGAVAEFLTGTVIPAIAAFVGFVSEQFSHLADFVRENWAGIQEAISHVVNVVQGIITAFVTVVQAIWRAWGDEILSIVRTVWDQMRNVVETVIAIIAGLIQAGLALINGDWGAAWDAIKGILSAAWDFMVGTVSNALSIIQSTISAAWDAVSAVTSAAWDAIKDAVEVAMRVILAAITLGFSELTIAIVQHRDDIVGFIGELPGRIRDALGDLGGLLYNAGRAIISGLLQGIKDAVGAVYDFVSGIAGKIADLKGPIDRDKRLLIPAGVAIMRGLEQGIASQQQSLENRLKGITSTIAGVGTLGGLPVGGAGASVAGGTTALTITGPLVVVQGGVAPGQEASIGAAVRQAVTQLVADGTVGRAISKRSQTYTTR